MYPQPQQRQAQPSPSPPQHQQQVQQQHAGHAHVHTSPRDPTQPSGAFTHGGLGTQYVQQQQQQRGQLAHSEQGQPCADTAAGSGSGRGGSGGGDTLGGGSVATQADKDADAANGRRNQFFAPPFYDPPLVARRARTDARAASSFSFHPIDDVIAAATAHAAKYGEQQQPASRQPPGPPPPPRAALQSQPQPQPQPQSPLPSPRGVLRDSLPHRTDGRPSSAHGATAGAHDDDDSPLPYAAHVGPSVLEQFASAAPREHQDPTRHRHDERMGPTVVYADADADDDGDDDTANGAEDTDEYGYDDDDDDDERYHDDCDGHGEDGDPSGTPTAAGTIKTVRFSKRLSYLQTGCTPPAASPSPSPSPSPSSPYAPRMAVQSTASRRAGGRAADAYHGTAVAQRASERRGQSTPVRNAPAAYSHRAPRHPSLLHHSAGATSDIETCIYEDPYADEEDAGEEEEEDEEDGYIHYAAGSVPNVYGGGAPDGADRGEDDTDDAEGGGDEWADDCATGMDTPVAQTQPHFGNMHPQQQAWAPRPPPPPVGGGSVRSHDDGREGGGTGMSACLQDSDARRAGDDTRGAQRNATAGQGARTASEPRRAGRGDLARAHAPPTPQHSHGTSDRLGAGHAGAERPIRLRSK